MNTITINILIGVLITLFPIIVINYKEIKTTKKQVIIWGIFSFLFSLLTLMIIKEKINYFALIPTVLISSILNYLIVEDKINLRKLPKMLMIFLLFYLSSLFQLIPIEIFKLDIYKLSAMEEILLIIFSNSVVVIILGIIYFKSLKEQFKKLKKNLYKDLDIGIKYWLIGLLVMMISNIIIGLFIKQAQATNEQAVQQLITSASYLSIIAIGILGPIIEELVFRKSFREVFKSKYLYILMSGLIFASLHVLPSLNSVWNLFYLIPYSSLGFAFAATYYKTNNIYAPILVHMFHNTVLTTVSLIGAMIVL